jgi:pyridoxine 5-phosphate synthase
VIKRIAGAGIPVSVFIDAEPRQVEAAKAAGASICELHTGPWAHVYSHPGQGMELERLAKAAALVRASGMQLNAGHALDRFNVGAIAALRGLHELHIGHSIVGRAIMVGMREAVREMKAAMAAGVQR